MAEEKQEGQKTVVSFVVGLLIGGLLVWAFSGPTEMPKEDTKKDAEKSETKDEATKTEDEVTVTEVKKDDTTKPVDVVKAVLPVGEGKISVGKQPADSSVTLASATYPVSEGWVGVRDYQDDRLGGVLGVVRFSEEQGLVPSEIVLQRATVKGNKYAIVVYKENGDRTFNLAEDVQIDTVFSTFTAE